jgi:photosystem II stability/assembly factor-like uncharacterized protein
MKPLIFFLSLLFNCAIIFAQQPQWILLRENATGVIAVDPTDSKTIYISGVLKTTDGGLTWTVHLDGFNLAFATDVIVDPNNPQMVYVCGYGLQMGIVKSINGGLTWTKSDTGIVTDHHGYSLGAMALDAKRNILYAGDFAAGGGAYRSLDGGKRWELLTKVFSTYDLLVDQEDGTVYAGTTNGVWKSHDQGRTWIRMSKGLPINSINPFSGDTLYFDARSIAKIKKSNTLYSALRDNGIYKSYDGGENWFSVNNGLIKGHTLHGVVVSQIDTNIVFAGGSSSTRDSIMSGLWRSTNGGQFWRRYHQGLPTASPDWIVAQHLLINDNDLYVELQGLDFRGFYKLSHITTGVNVPDHPDQSFTYYLHHNYPNPFKNSTSINYALKTGEYVTVRVFDLEGKEVNSLVKQWQYQGNYSIQWNGKNAKGGDVPSGIYLIHFRAGSFTQSRKILLVR